MFVSLFYYLRHLILFELFKETKREKKTCDICANNGPRLFVVGRYALFIQQKHTSNNENNKNTPKKAKTKNICCRKCEQKPTNAAVTTKE